MTEPGPAHCHDCRAAAPERPETWSLQVSACGRSWLCELCTRDNLWAIEGKLEQARW